MKCWAAANARCAEKWEETAKDATINNQSLSTHSKSKQNGGICFSAQKMAEKVCKSRQQKFARNARESWTFTYFETCKLVHHD